MQEEAAFSLSYGNAQLGLFSAALLRPMSIPCQSLSLGWMDMLQIIGIDGHDPKCPWMDIWPRGQNGTWHGENPQGCVQKPQAETDPKLDEHQCWTPWIRAHATGAVLGWGQRAFTAGPSWQNHTWVQNPTATALCSSLPALGLFSRSAPSSPSSPMCVTTDLHGTHCCLPPAPPAEGLPAVLFNLNPQSHFTFCFAKG